MNHGVFRVLALARPRSPWLADLTSWSGTGSLEIDLVRCISCDEVRARLAGPQRVSAVLLDAEAVGIDRDLLADAREAGTASIVITVGTVRRDWIELGADLVLDQSFSRDDLLCSLRSLSSPISTRADLPVIPAPSIAPSATRCPLIAVTGSGGSGTSTVALAIAQHLDGVALVDAALDASLALLIGHLDPLPALQEFIEAHRTGSPGLDEARRLLHRCERHDLDLLPGLRHHRDWTALQPRAIASALDTLRNAYRFVVADVDHDLEGEAETGSFDIGDRNALARVITAGADLIIVTGRPDLIGMSRQVEIISRLIHRGIAPQRIIPITLRPIRWALTVADIRRTVGTLLKDLHPGMDLVPPTVVELPRDLELLLLDAAPLPAALVDPLGAVIPAQFAPATASSAELPVLVRPGTLGIAS